MTKPKGKLNKLEIKRQIEQFLSTSGSKELENSRPGPKNLSTQTAPKEYFAVQTQTTAREIKKIGLIVGLLAALTIGAALADAKTNAVEIVGSLISKYTGF